MRNIISVAHISLDGFVAGPNGELDGFPSGEENLEFVCGLTQSADAALFGRVSYELLNGYWPNAKNIPQATAPEKAYSNWYNDAQKIVISSSMSIEDAGKTIIINTNFPEEIIKIKTQPGKDILIFGSPSITQQLLQLQLIDEFWIFVNPVIFGKGISLFKEKANMVRLQLISAPVSFQNGEVALHYSVHK